MLSKLHHTLQGKDLSEESAKVVVNNTRQLLTDIEYKFQSKDEEWESDILSVIRFLEAVQKGTYTAKLRALGFVIDHWDELSLEFRLGYNNQIAEFVFRETELQLDTVMNYWRGIKTFENVRPLGKVAVVQRDRFNRPVLDKAKNPVIEYRDFAIDAIPPTKLAVMRAVAERGEMSEKRWSMLADPGVTVSDLQVEIYKVDKPGDPDPSMKFELLGDIIVVTEFGISLDVGQIFFDRYDDPDLGRKAIRRILQCLSIKLDEEVIANHTRRHQILQVYGRTDGNNSDNQAASSSSSEGLLSNAD